MRKGRCYGVFCSSTRPGLLLWCQVNGIKSWMISVPDRQNKVEHTDWQFANLATKSADTANSDKVPPALTLHISTLTFNQIHGIVSSL